MIARFVRHNFGCVNGDRLARSTHSLGRRILAAVLRADSRANNETTNVYEFWAERNRRDDKSRSFPYLK